MRNIPWSEQISNDDLKNYTQRRSKSLHYLKSTIKKKKKTCIETRKFDPHVKKSQQQKLASKWPDIRFHKELKVAIINVINELKIILKEVKRRW